MDTKPTNEVPRIVELTPRNYGARPSRSTVKWERNVCKARIDLEVTHHGYGICALGIR